MMTESKKQQPKKKEVKKETKSVLSAFDDFMGCGGSGNSNVNYIIEKLCKKIGL